MSGLQSEIQRARELEMARGIRALLAQPMLTAAQDPDGFEAVRRHRPELLEWFEVNCGWRLEVEPREGYARLNKVRDWPDHTRPARRDRATRAPFDRRRYLLLCVIGAELLSTPATTIGMLADRVTQATGVDPQLPTFDSGRHEDRRSYVDALKLLQALGILTVVDGDTDSFLDQRESARVLYRVDCTRLARLLAAPQAPSRLDGPDLDRLLEEPRYGSAVDPEAEVATNQRNLWLRHSVTRRVLDDPVVYLMDLTEAQRAYLSTLTGRRVVRQAAEQAGLQLEERAEGLLAVDPDAVATDQRFPADGSVVKQAALLLLDALLASDTAVPLEGLSALLHGRLLEHPDWARTYQSDGGAARLTEEALDLLVMMGLAAAEGAAISPLPAAARYAVGPVAVRRAGLAGQ